MAHFKKGFEGNYSIRGVGIPIEWDEHKLSEFMKCKEDPDYFIENYIKIRHVDEEDLIPFRLRDYQREMLSKTLRSRKVIVKLPRQAGKTVCISAVLLWYIIFNRNYSILVAAHNGSKANEVLASIKAMYEELPDWLQHGVTEWNKGKIVLESGSRIKASTTSMSSARGDTYNCVYLDEAAFIATHLAEEFFKSVFPTISSGKTTKIIITSTPKGMNHFHSMWDAAIKKKSDYETVEIKWNDVPGRDEAFRNAVISEFGQTYFDQEYGAEFIGSDNTLIKGVKLMMMASDVERPLHDNGKSRIFAHPEKGRHYAVTVDVSEGLGQDYSVVMVFDITTLPYTVAAIYQDNEISPMVLPGVILDMARGYNEAMVLVESNFGQQVADILWQDLEYEHVIMTARGKNNTKKDVVTLSTKSLPGVNMNALNKRLGCNTIKTILEADRLVIKDAKTYDEFLRFAKKKTSYAAVSGNDDLVMCCVLFGWLIDQGYVRDSTDVDIRAELNRQAAEAIERDMLPFGFEYEEPAPVIHIKKGPVEESLEPFMNWDRFEKIAAPEIKGREDPVNISTLFAQMFNQGPKSS